MDSINTLRMRFTSQLPLVNRQWLRVLAERLGDTDVTGACVVPLLLIGRSGGGVHQVAIAERANVSGPSMVRIVDRLSAAGLVRREEAPGDRRAKTLWLTDAGQLRARELEQRLDALREDVFGALAPGDIEAALRVSEAILAAANAVSSAPDHDITD